MDAEIYGEDNRSPLVSFNFKNIHSHDVASVLDDEGVAIRSGHHCVLPLHKKMNISGSCRASFYIYNNEGDLEIFRRALKKSQKVFGGKK